MVEKIKNLENACVPYLLPNSIFFCFRALGRSIWAKNLRHRIFKGLKPVQAGKSKKGLADPNYVGKTFKYTEVWHQDLVGVKDVLPPIVSSMYMIVTPEWGGKTKFASLENAYESMSYLYKSFYKNLDVLYQDL